ncbi:RCC1 domain-containing protein [Microbacterium sp. NPDC077663]|uniref:RCC1 domain-containing protein n=1 Tax=Microbacterium sp. NPDC077663 TaxID=3364189 RepID=UPI0037CB2E95
MRLTRFVLTGLTFTVVAILGVLPTTTAAFTDATTVTENTVRTGNLAAATFTTTTQTSPTSTTLEWTPTDTTASSLQPAYIVQRSTTPDGANPINVYTGTDTTVVDIGNVAPQRPATPITAITSGQDHSLSVSEDGSVYAWGSNGSGQLGDGTTARSLVPVHLAAQLFGGQKVTAVASGDHHSVALAENGRVFTWGNNNFGQLGNGTTVASRVPVEIDANRFGGRRISAVAAGDYFTVVVADDGSVFSWGSNGAGQLGNGKTGSAPYPVLVGAQHFGGQKVAALSAGSDHTVAVTTDGSVYAWGSNGSGQLGIGAAPRSHTPAQVGRERFGGQGVKTIVAGDYHTAAIATDGSVYTWGWNGSGQLGDGTLNTSSTPVHLSSEQFGGRAITSIAAGFAQTAAVAEDGSVYDWGFNSRGQLGNGTTVRSLAPVHLESNSFGAQKIRAVTAKDQHTLAIADDGTLYAWGNNENGQLGNQSTSTINSAPIHVTISGAAACVPDAESIDDGSCSLSAETTYYYRLSYTLGRWDAPPSAWTPVTTALSPLTPTIGKDSTASSVNVTWPAAKMPSTYTLERSTTLDGGDPVTVYTGSDLNTVDAGGIAPQLRDVSFSATSAGSDHVIALTTDGAVYAWGANRYGQLGNNSPREQPTPVRLAADVFGGQKIVGVSAGGDHSAALAADGSVYMWGNGGNGQLGNNKQTVSSTPVRLGAEVFGGQSIVSISAGETHTAAVAADGSVYTWGLNLSGQLGNNSTAIRSLTPVRLGTDVFGGQRIVNVSAGAHHTAALAADGSVYAWGLNGYGQLGNNSTTGRSLTPVRLGREVFGGREIVSISAGGNHTAALAADGSAYMWGYNMYGQLGNNSTTNSGTPVRVERELFGGQNITSISAGYNITVAVAADGVAYAWGDNRYGQIGNNTTNNSSTPVRLAPELFGGQKVGSMSAGFNVTVAVAADGTIRVWGYNGSGQLGTGAATPSSSPAPTRVPIQNVACAPGAATSSDGLCSLSSDTTYYYRLSYTLKDGREGPASAWTALRTPGF